MKLCTALDVRVSYFFDFKPGSAASKPAAVIYVDQWHRK